MESPEETADYLVPVARSNNSPDGSNPSPPREYENVPSAETDHDYDDVQKQQIPSTGYVNVTEKLSERRQNLSGNYESLNTNGPHKGMYEKLDPYINRNGNI